MAKGKQEDKKKVDPKKKVSLLAKAKNAGGGKAKKKKWSKGKVKEKLNNAVFFDQDSYGKLIKEIPKNKLAQTVRPSTMSSGESKMSLPKSPAPPNSSTARCSWM